MKRRPTVIELFCGAGGTSSGFSTAGYDVRLGLDIAPHAVETFRINHADSVAVALDVRKAKGKDLLRMAGLRSLDVLLGGPSCQGYSTIGKRIEDDPRNFLFTHYIRLVKELQPSWILFENVKGMKFHGGGKFLEQLCSELESLAYTIAPKIINAADYGVPQRRERLLLIGTNTGTALSFPDPSNFDARCPYCAKPDGGYRVPKRRKTMFGNDECFYCRGTGIDPEMANRRSWVSVWDAIGDLPVLGEAGGTEAFTPYTQDALTDFQKYIRQGSTGYTLHKAKPVSEFAFDIIRHIPEGKGIRSISEQHLPERFRVMRRISDGSLRQDCTTLYHRLSRSLPSYTITCSFTNVASGAFVHPLAHRAITVREAARLQSFPDRFQFVPTRLKDQIGNAVPPLLAEVFARHILKMYWNQPQSDTVRALFSIRG